MNKLNQENIDHMTACEENPLTEMWDNYLVPMMGNSAFYLPLEKKTDGYYETRGWKDGKPPMGYNWQLEVSKRKDPSDGFAEFTLYANPLCMGMEAPSESVVASPITIFTYEYDKTGDIDFVNEQISWAHDGTFDALYNELSKYVDFHGITANYSGEKSVHIHIVFDPNADYPAFDNTPRTTRLGLMAVWNKLATIVNGVLKPSCGMAYLDKTLEQPEKWRRLPNGMRHLTEKSTIGVEAGEDVFQLAIYEKFRKDTFKESTQSYINWWGDKKEGLTFITENDFKKAKSAAAVVKRSIVKPADLTEEKVAEIYGILTDIQKHHSRLSYPDWSKVTWAAITELGEFGMEVMADLWEEEKDGEYDSLFRQYNPKNAPSIGSVIHMIRQDDPSYIPEKVAPKPDPAPFTTVIPIETVEEQDGVIDDIIFPTDKMPQPFRQALKGIMGTTNATIEAAATLALSTIATAAQHTYNVNPQWYAQDKGVPISDYFVMVAPPSAGKTSMYKVISKSIKEYESKFLSAYNAKRSTYNLDYKQWVKDYRTSYENNQPLPTQPSNPLSCKRIMGNGNITLNGLIRNLAENHPCASILTSEGDVFFGSNNFRDQEKGSHFCASLNTTWDGDTIGNETGMEEDKGGSRYVATPRVTMGVMIQPARLAEFWEGKKHRHIHQSGFRNRILVVDVRGLVKNAAPKTKKETLEKKKPNHQMLQWHNRITELIERPIISTPDEGGWYSFDWKVIDLTDDAYPVYRDFNETYFEHADKNDEWHTYSERLPQHAIRLAALLAVYGGMGDIDKAHMEAGCALADFYFEHMKALDLSVHLKESNKSQFVAKVLKWALIKPSFTHRQLRQTSWARDDDSMWTERIVKEMASDGMLSVQNDKYAITAYGKQVHKENIGGK